MHRGVKLIVVETFRGFNHRTLELLERHRRVAVGVEPLHRLAHLDLVTAGDQRDGELGELVAVELAGVVLVHALEDHLQLFDPVSLCELYGDQDALHAIHERFLVDVLHNLQNRVDVLVLVHLPVPVLVHPRQLHPRLLDSLPGVDLPAHKHELVKVERAVAVAVHLVEGVPQLLLAIHLVERAVQVLGLGGRLRGEPRLLLALSNHRPRVFAQVLAEKLEGAHGPPVGRDVTVLVPVLPRRHPQPLGFDRAHHLVQPALQERHHLGFQVLPVVFAVVVPPRVRHLFVRPRQEVFNAVFELLRGEVVRELEHGFEVFRFVHGGVAVLVHLLEPRARVVLAHGLAHARREVEHLLDLDAAAVVAVEGVEHHAKGLGSVHGPLLGVRLGDGIRGAPRERVHHAHRVARGPIRESTFLHLF